jgi:hypothetical protein
MYFRVFINPGPQLLHDVVVRAADAANVNPETIPYQRAFRERRGRYVDHLSRVVISWWHDRHNDALMVRLGEL